MLFIFVPFLVVFLLFVLGIYMRVEVREGTQREALVNLDTGLRAATTLALLGLIVLVFNTVQQMLGDNGFVAKLIAAVQAGGITWPIALISSVLIVAMTTVVMSALWSIWHIVRQD